jgi:hypothetical protein
MAFEQLRAEIEQLVQLMDNEPEDIHELHARIRSKLNELKATGMPLPDDLVALERRLDREERRSSTQASDSGAQEPRQTRPARSRPARTAKRSAKAARKAPRSGAKKSARSTAKTSRRTGAAKAKRPPKASRKAQAAGRSKKAKRPRGRRR